MLRKIVTIGFFMFLLSPTIFAHGMDGAGPNGGNITMPANYHVELVADKKNSVLKIYLLDIAFKNPTVKESSVALSINSDNQVSCTVEKDYFICPIKPLKVGDKVLITSKRLNISGNTASYTFPFKY